MPGRPTTSCTVRPDEKVTYGSPGRSSCSSHRGIPAPWLVAYGLGRRSITARVLGVLFSAWTLTLRGSWSGGTGSHGRRC